MMDNKDLEAEIHPLKNEDRTSQENLGNRTEKEDPCKSLPPQSQLSRCRTVAFFLSLFICLFVVFVVSFIIPCPDRPVSQQMWRINYDTAVTYDFLAMKDINRDRIQDILFLYKNANSSNNFNLSCADEGFSSPCTFAAAVSGANGSLLWERPVAQDVTVMQCTGPQQRASGALSACVLVGGPGSVIAVDPFTGETLWSHPGSLGRNVSILSLLLGVPDVNNDGLPDLLVLTREEKEVNGYVYSGSTGSQVGRKGSLGTDGEGGSLLHVTRTGAHYLLFPCAPEPSATRCMSLGELATICSSWALRPVCCWMDRTSHPGGPSATPRSSENPSSVTTNQIPCQWSLKMELASTDRSCSWTSAPGSSCGTSPSQASLGAPRLPTCQPQTTAQHSSSGASLRGLAQIRRRPGTPHTASTCSTPPYPASFWSWPTSPQTSLLLKAEGSCVSSARLNFLGPRFGTRAAQPPDTARNQ
ncbi:protein FAM234A isoform X4 [Elephas maximus indicus]|uniref:protein FAM234A isoform X4 n=1 Tax=Elephas maximus indicus TaxID=99487 RepID=UPI0021171E6C|nr:protein FAM234A isoform X4 [Elephas maximus indicus]